MKIEVEETETKGRYVMVDGDAGEAGEMTFSKAGASMIIIDHTDVSDAYRGRRVGAELVARAVDDARLMGKKLMPLCPYARSEFRKHPEWNDVLAS